MNQDFTERVDGQADELRAKLRMLAPWAGVTDQSLTLLALCRAWMGTLGRDCGSEWERLGKALVVGIESGN